MEVIITTQHDDESIRTKRDQFMEEKNEHDSEQVPNQKPSTIQETSVPI